MNSSVIIFGLGSHAEVVLGILMEQGYSDIAFVGIPGKEELIDLSEVVREKYLFSYNEFCNEFITDEKNPRQAIIAIGDNWLRKEIRNRIDKDIKSIRWINAIHPTAIISKGVKMGVGNVITVKSVINFGSSIGNHTIINTSASVDHHCIIKDFVHLAPQSVCCGNVYIGEGVFCGVNTSLVPRSKLRPWTFQKAGTIVKDNNSSIPMYTPNSDWFGESPKDALESGWISSIGPYIDKSTHLLEKILGNGSRVILVNNGTSACHLMFLALKKFHPEIKTIYMPDRVYVAVWNTALYEYKIENLRVLPWNPNSWNQDMNLDKLELGAAVVIVHNLGNIIDVEAIKKERPDLTLLEDNCEGFMGMYNDKYTGSSDAVLCSTASFFGNKNITCGEGGAIITHDDDVYNFLKMSHNQGNTKERYVHGVIGYNYRMTNIQAAFLYDQFNKWNEIINAKKHVFETYNKCRSKSKILLDFTSLPEVTDTTVHANWMYALKIKTNFEYEAIRKYFESEDIETRPFFYPINRHHHLSTIECQKVDTSYQIVMFPSYPKLKEREIAYIMETLQGLLKLNNLLFD